MSKTLTVSDEVWDKIEDMKVCKTCGRTKKSAPTPDGDEICPSCGDRDMVDL